MTARHPPPARRRADIALRLVAIAFVLSGVLPLVELIVAFLRGYGPPPATFGALLFGAAILNVAIAVGLLARRPRWRWIAIALLAVDVLLAAPGAVFGMRLVAATDADGVAVYILGVLVRAGAGVPTALLFAVSLLTTLAQLWILTLPGVRRLFPRTEAPAT